MDILWVKVTSISKSRFIYAITCMLNCDKKVILSIILIHFYALIDVYFVSKRDFGISTHAYTKIIHKHS